MRFYRIARAADASPAAAFSGLGATKAAHRWTWAGPHLRAVYCSESIALACLETLVHIRPLPRRFPPSVFYTVDVPDELLHRPEISALPPGWNSPVAPSAARDFGTEFLTGRRAVGLVVPTSVVPVGVNVVINPLHPAFRLGWVKGPHPFDYDGRLK